MWDGLSTGLALLSTQVELEEKRLEEVGGGPHWTQGPQSVSPTVSQWPGILALEEGLERG